MGNSLKAPSFSAPFFLFFEDTSMCVYVCPCVISWDLPGCCQHVTQTPLKVFSPRCLCVSAPTLLRECESLPSRPNLSSRPHKASAVPKLPHAGAPQALVFTTGNNTEEPFSPSAALHQRARPRGGGGGCLGIEEPTCFTSHANYG